MGAESGKIKFIDLNRDGQDSGQSRDAVLGNLLAGYRERQGRSAQELADALGLESVDTLLRFESGEEPVPMDLLFAASNELNIPPEEIIELLQSFHLPQSP